MSVDKIKFDNAKDLAAGTIKALVFAPPGHGKTFLSTTTGAKTLIISAESGLLSIRGHDIDVWDVTIDANKKPIPKDDPAARLKRLEEIYDILVKGTDHKWVFIDSITEVSDIVLAILNKAYPDPKDGLVKWGHMLRKMTEFVKGFRDLAQYNVVFTALDDVEKDENNRRFQTIDVHGKTARRLPGWFDEVFYLQVDENGARSLITQPTPKMKCKDRSGKLAAVEPPNMAYIAEKILSAGKGTDGK